VDGYSHRGRRFIWIGIIYKVINHYFTSPFFKFFFILIHFKKNNLNHYHYNNLKYTLILSKSKFTKLLRIQAFSGSLVLFYLHIETWHNFIVFGK
jgi:hypothetical protein